MCAQRTSLSLARGYLHLMRPALERGEKYKEHFHSGVVIGDCVSYQQPARLREFLNDRFDRRFTKVHFAQCLFDTV